MPNYYPPVGTGYQPMFSSQQQLNNQIQWVQGEAGAKAYPIAPGSTVLLMDSESSVFYIKSSDATGIPQPLRSFEYTERVHDNTLNTDSGDYVTRKEFDELKKMIDDLTK